jgi:hypothetical protein
VNQIYHNFFYIENIFRNLLINNLVDKNQLKKIRVHYNFLSKYTHTGTENIKIWNDSNNSISGSRYYDEQVYQKLIGLYTIKLFYLYLNIYVNGYKCQNYFQSIKYNQIIKELQSLSNDVWFFDDEPTEFDIKNTEYLKQVRNANDSDPVSDEFIYYNNPLGRMKNLLLYQKQNNG